ncbi:MAG: transcriptional regulator NrdR [Patescibacteria group bacterium]|nr:transcriptional regulator NrdR [Patescibacteria group bacterium]
MHCPVCSHEETKVVDSRESGDGLRIRRRRECDGCGNRFTTVEEMELLDLTLVKRDGRREAYDREKLEAGLKKSLEKRPCTPEQFKTLVGAIERDLQRLRKDIMSTQEVGEIVILHLREFDPVAYLRFASVYKSFDDIKTFREEVDQLAEKQKAA